LGFNIHEILVNLILAKYMKAALTWLYAQSVVSG